MNVTTYQDRRHAGRLLAEPLQRYADQQDAVVLGVPRGGIPVAHEVARHLRLPLDIIVVRKLAVPDHEEAVLGAVASGGASVIHNTIVKAYHVSPENLAGLQESGMAEVRRREALYRGHAGAPELKGKVAILVDDGMATGTTLCAAVESIRLHGPKAIIVAVPTASPDSCALLEPMVDELVALETPEGFHAVGQWYEDFSQATDSELSELCRQHPPAVGQMP